MAYVGSSFSASKTFQPSFVPSIQALPSSVVSIGWPNDQSGFGGTVKRATAAWSYGPSAFVCVEAEVVILRVCSGRSVDSAVRLARRELKYLYAVERAPTAADHILSTGGSATGDVRIADVHLAGDMITHKQPPVLLRTFTRGHRFALAEDTVCEGRAPVRQACRPGSYAGGGEVMKRLDGCCVAIGRGCGRSQAPAAEADLLVRC